MSVNADVTGTPLAGSVAGGGTASGVPAALGGSPVPVGGSRADGLARNRITASASIGAVLGVGGVTRLPELSSQVPLVLRRTPEAVYVVGGAAGPIGGDVLSLRISVGAGAFLRVRTAAASIALPGPLGASGPESVLRVAVTVGAGGVLEYLPEPVVVSAGARHAVVVSVSLEEGASLLLRDEVLLGRHGETGGAYRSVLRVSYAGRPLLRQSLEVAGTDQASMGPAVLAGHRAVGALLCVDPALNARAARPAFPSDTMVSGSLAAAGSRASTRGPAGTGSRTGKADQTGCSAVMPLAGPGYLVTALAHDAVTLRKRLTLSGR